MLSRCGTIFMLLYVLVFAGTAAQAQGRNLAVMATPAERRIALVIGNDSYQSVSRLENARADARAMARSLELSGFAVTLKLNVTEKAMKETVRHFKNQVGGGDVAVFYYAGHGVQLGATNYLLPTDIRGDSEDQVRDEALPLQRILDDLQDQKAKFSLAIIDACRDNPFKSGGKRAIGGRGLAPTTAATGQMVLFSAGANQQALDKVGPGDRNPNGLFTRVLLSEMNKPGLPVDRVLRNVREQVVALARSVNHEQVPALYDQSLGEFYFRPGSSSQLAPAAASAPINVPPVEPEATEAALWREIAGGNSREEFEAYVRRYPAGFYTGQARERIEQIEAGAEVERRKQDDQAWLLAEKAGTPAAYEKYLSSHAQGGFAPVAEVRLRRLKAEEERNRFSPGKIIRDCIECPEMVMVPAGNFQMGSSASNEAPLHTVSIDRPFAIGRTEVTQGQWRTIMGSNPSHFNTCGDNCPVENVSWDDAQDFIRKLNTKTGKQYRLPSEAEWEYACRAGRRDEYCGEGSLDGIAWYVANSNRKSQPVAQKQPNAFGLYDMSGNVWEWTQDAYNSSYQGAPTDGSAWEKSGEPNFRVLRGGSWSNLPSIARAANRYRSGREQRDDYFGLRVYRALP